MAPTDVAVKWLTRSFGMNCGRIVNSASLDSPAGNRCAAAGLQIPQP
jgi:hypothetical protein